MNAEMVSRLAESFDVVEAANRNIKPMLDRLERVLVALEAAPEKERDTATRRLRVAMMDPPKKKKKPARSGLDR